MQSDPSELVRVRAAIAVWRLDKDAERTVPVMLAEIEKNGFGNFLVVSEALEGLAEMGSAARSSVPTLRAWLQREDNWISEDGIKRALVSIEGQQDKPSANNK